MTEQAATEMVVTIAEEQGLWCVLNGLLAEYSVDEICSALETFNEGKDKTTEKKLPQLYLEIEGGVLQEFHANIACDVLVIDHDNMAVGEPPSLLSITAEKEIDANAEYESLMAEYKQKKGAM